MMLAFNGFTSFLTMESTNSSPKGSSDPTGACSKSSSSRVQITAEETRKANVGAVASSYNRVDNISMAATRTSTRTVGKALDLGLKHSSHASSKNDSSSTSEDLPLGVFEVSIYSSNVAIILCFQPSY